jgi:hypothetical protein
MRSIVLSLAAALAVSACGSDIVQTSSGAEYLARYEPVETKPQPVVQRLAVRAGSGTEILETTVQTVSTDDLIRHAANIEPLLRLPARIGLARIEAGQLTAIPAGESALWMALAERHAALGGFAAIDPFLADYTLRTVLPQDQRARRRDASDIVTRIRLGAARQHMDAVLIYEVGSRQRRVKAIEGLAPIRVLGAAPLPAAPIEKEGVARAFLMDVRNGYPYGTASASIDLASLNRPFWSDKPKDTLGIEAKTRITGGLVTEVEKMVGGVLEAMAARKPPAS